MKNSKCLGYAIKLNGLYPTAAWTWRRLHFVTPQLLHYVIFTHDRNRYIARFVVPGRQQCRDVPALVVTTWFTRLPFVVGKQQTCTGLGVHVIIIRIVSIHPQPIDIHSKNIWNENIVQQTVVCYIYCFCLDVNIISSTKLYIAWLVNWGYHRCLSNTCLVKVFSTMDLEAHSY